MDLKHSMEKHGTDCKALFATLVEISAEIHHCFVGTLP